MSRYHPTHYPVDAYLETGEEIHVIAYSNGQYVYHQYYEYDDAECGTIVEYGSEIFHTKTVFDKAPTVVFDEEIAKRREIINDLYDKERQTREEYRKAEQDFQQQTIRLQKYKGLECLMDILDRKITHYAVIPSYGKPYIVEENGDDRGWSQYRGRTHRTLVMKGTDAHVFTWGMYKTGSDYDMESENVFPCTSEDEAKRAIENHFEEKLRNDIEHGRAHGSTKEQCEAYGYPLPKEWLEIYYANAIKNQEERIQRQEDDLEKAQKHLAELKSILD